MYLAFINNLHEPLNSDDLAPRPIKQYGFARLISHSSRAELATAFVTEKHQRFTVYFTLNTCPEP